MKKLEKRAVFCLLLALLLVVGSGVFVFRFIRDGSSWASFPSNLHLYQDGFLKTGRILDRDGALLSASSNGQRIYNDSQTVRMATLHAVGDPAGNIGTGAQTVFSAKLSGYNILTGVSSLGGGRDLYLTIDADVCAAAYTALNGRSGTVGVYNYETGEIICMVSSPTFDPENPPDIDEDDEEYEGVYLNRLLSATFVPGSIFKLVTTAAAIDTIPDILERTFHCDGSLELSGTAITCPRAHGDLTLSEALAVSCNCTYGTLAEELGAATLNEYVDKTGLTSSLSVNGIPTAKGTFSFDDEEKAELAWSGIGQGQDMINPCSMMVYMGAIANGGSAAVPQILSRTTTQSGVPLDFYRTQSTGQMLSEETASLLSNMMRGNVVTNYGAGNFPDLDICAKSGTAEVGSDQSPHAWFAGFLRDSDNPLAFIVLVENGGSGSLVAGRVANQVLQAAVK